MTVPFSSYVNDPNDVNSYKISPDSGSNPGLVLSAGSSYSGSLLDIRDSANAQKMRVEANGTVVHYALYLAVGGISIGSTSNKTGGVGSLGFSNIPTEPVNTNGGIAIYAYNNELRCRIGTTTYTINMTPVV